MGPSPPEPNLYGQGTDIYSGFLKSGALALSPDPQWAFWQTKQPQDCSVILPPDTLIPLSVEDGGAMSG